MSEVRKQNIDAISSWLHLHGNEYPSGPQELIVLESRKLEGKVPLKDWYTNGIIDHAARWESHVLLRRIVDGDLRHFRWHMWINLRDIFLADPDPDPTLLDKWAADGGPGAQFRLRMFRDSLEWIADRVENYRDKKFRLTVPIIELAKLREIGRPNHRHDKVREIFRRHRHDLGRNSKAVNKTAEDTGYSRSQIERITVDLRAT